MADFSLEDEAGGVIAGCDEAGRGPLIHSVCAVCCILPRNLSFSSLIDDSKRMSAKRRAVAEAELREKAIFGVGEASVEEIFELNILGATMLAMRRSLDRLMEKGVHPDLVLVDGNKVPDFGGINGRAVVGGDAKSLSIAAASILAKEHRDRAVRRLAEAYPQYGWERNSGYGTAEHLEAMRKYGVTPHHRAGFAPVKELLATS